LVEIHEKQHVFLKIFVTDRLSPARVFINYGDDFYIKPHFSKNQKSNMAAIFAYKVNERQGKKTLVDLQAFYSKDVNEPTHEMCDRMWINPVMTQLNNDKERYEQDYIYLSLYSQTGCTIECGVKFPEEKTAIDFSKRNQALTKREMAFDDDESAMIKYFKENFKDKWQRRIDFEEWNGQNADDFAAWQEHRTTDN
jgi:phosphoribosylformylglycinamidine (FGAM) synthase PurS component